MTDIASKAEAVVAFIRGLGSCAVAFSGGVDSAVVAKAAQLALGERAVAVTGTSASLAEGELDEARELAELIGIRHLVIATGEFDNPNYTRNAVDRCYFCKTELYEQLERRIDELGVDVILNGANADDAGDYRPGERAAAEHSHPPSLGGVRLDQGRRPRPGRASGDCPSGTSRPCRVWPAEWRTARR